MWLSPLKGAHLTLGQLDKTLPVDLGATATIGGKSVEVNKKIERGNIVFIKAGATGKDAPRFQLYTSTEAAKPNAVPYIVLVGVKDFQAGMAGNVGQAPEVDDEFVEKGTAGGDTWLGKANVVGVGKDATGASYVKGPRITAISLVQPAEWQTTAFDKDVATSLYVGAPLTVNDKGVLTLWTSGKNIVGYVTATPKTRWINDLGASADGARISGGNASVIEFSTAWIPVAASGTAGADGAGTAPAALNVGAPKVSGQTAKAPEGNKAPDGNKPQGK